MAHDAVRRVATLLPIFDWAPRYTRTDAVDDSVAAAIVTIMLVPQSLAYAMLAGLPPQAGLYASILPLVAYALFGSSRTLAVGPVAVVSLMTAAALAPVAPQGSPAYAAAAIALALLSGAVLLAMAALDLADELSAVRRKLDEAQREANARLAEAEARARRAEQVAREAIAEALTDIDRALAADDALVAARAADGAPL